MTPEDSARALKASRIADVLFIECEAWSDTDVALLIDVDQATRDDVATVAKCKTPSEKTWGMAVASVLRRRDPVTAGNVDAIIAAFKDRKASM